MTADRAARLRGRKPEWDLLVHRVAEWWFVRRRRLRAGRPDGLPPMLVAGTGAVLFGVAGAGLVGGGGSLVRGLRLPAS